VIKLAILVFGIDETASAVARMLLLSGYAVCDPPACAAHTAVPENGFRRRLVRWRIDARRRPGARADLSSDFLIGLSNRMYIPVLTHPLAEVVERWPWM